MQNRGELRSHVLERALLPLDLNRKKRALCGLRRQRRALSEDRIARRTCKLKGVDPQAYLADVITRIGAGHPQSRIDELLPWAYAARQLKAVA